MVFILGPAGSGKSTFTSSFSNFLNEVEIDNIRVNLDPAVESLPYVPDVDVREYITAREVMEKYGLGPNGAIIAATDMLIKFLKNLKEEIISLKPGYVLVDTPGQLELFAFRQSGKEIISYLSGERASMVFIIDTILALLPSSFVSSLLLSASVFFRFNLPMVLALNKIDMIDERKVNEILNWIENPEEIYTTLARERSLEAFFHENIVRVIEDFLRVFKCIPISSTKNLGLENVYSVLQQIYIGGEDFTVLTP